MQGDSTTLEPASDRRSAQDAYVGRRVAFVASDLTDADVEELTQQGLILLERNEDGYTVFVTAADEEMAAEAITDSEDGEKDEDEDEDEDEGEDDEDEGEEVDEDEDEDEDNENDPDQYDESAGTDYKGRSTPGKNKFREFHVHGVSIWPGKDLEINCKLDVATACDTKDATVVKHYMKLEYLQLMLPNYIYQEGNKGHFVHRIIVTAKTTEEWRLKIKRMFAEPSADSHPNTLTFQDSSAKGVVGSLNSTGLVQVQASCNRSKALSFSDTEYGWSRAEVDDYPETDIRSWSVKWTWNLRYWKGGHQVFNQEKPWKFNTPFNISKPREYLSRTLPELPYFSRPDIPRIALSNLQENLAEWRSSPETEGVRNIEWDVEVQLFTVRLQKREWSLTQGLKRSYEAEMLGPGQITTITERVTVRD